MMSTTNLIPAIIMFAVTAGFILLGYNASPVSEFHLRRRERRRDNRTPSRDRREPTDIICGDVAYWIYHLTWLAAAVILLLDFEITFAPMMH